MHPDPSAGALTGAVGLLERAVTFLLGSLQAVTPAALAGPTPCAGWTLLALLRHLDDSLRALQEAADSGVVVPWRPGRRSADPVATLRAAATGLVGAWTPLRGQHVVSVGGTPLTSGIVASAGALEIAVHGWDVARACRWQRSIPPALAEELLELAPLLVTDGDRAGRFAAAGRLCPTADPGDRLIVFLGRPPDWRAPADHSGLRTTG